MQQNRTSHFSLVGVAVIIAATIGSAAGADTVNLTSSQDVTIYDSSGSISNAKGQYCFVGENGMGIIRRTLMRFDLSSIPAGSAITAVTLTLNMSMSSGGATNVALYRVTTSWGEGTSLPTGNGGEGTTATPNDATWTYRFYNTTLWAAQGGSFVATSSASTSVNATGLYNWSSAQMVADVQQWLNSPGGNYGWIIRGSETTVGTSKRFDTREGSASVRPKLTVTYTPNACTPDITHDGTVNVSDLLAVINAWGPCAIPNNCPADIAPPGGNGVVNISDLLAVINGWGPCP